MAGSCPRLAFVAGDEVLTIKQVAAELGVPNTRAMDLVRKGRLALSLIHI